MDLHELHCVRAIAQSGGVTAAAHKLNLSKSAVSKYLTRLEARLGVTLFERSSRRVRLTKIGEQLLPRIESVLADTDRLFEHASDASSAPQGIVRIAATPELGGRFAQVIGPRLVERFPHVRIAMTSTYDVEDLQDPDYDIALRVGEVRDDRLIARPLGKLHRVLVASPAFLAAHPIRRVSDLARVPCLIFSSRRPTATWTLVKHGSRRPARVEVQGSIAIQSFNGLLPLARDGLGVANLPAVTASRDLQTGDLVRCLTDYRSDPLPFWLAYRVGVDRIRRVRAVIDLALEFAPSAMSDDRSAPSRRL